MGYIQLCNLLHVFDGQTLQVKLPKSKGQHHFCLLGLTDETCSLLTKLPACKHLRYMVLWRDLTFVAASGFQKRHHAMFEAVLPLAIMSLLLVHSMVGKTREHKQGPGPNFFRSSWCC